MRKLRLFVWCEERQWRRFANGVECAAASAAVPRANLRAFSALQRITPELFASVCRRRSRVHAVDLRPARLEGFA